MDYFQKESKCVYKGSLMYATSQNQVEYYIKEIVGALSVLSIFSFFHTCQLRCNLKCSGKFGNWGWD